MNGVPKRGQHAVKIFVSTELRARLSALSESLDRPLADVCRTLMWIALPILEGLDQAQQRGTDWWVQRVQGRDQEENNR
ncbi:MAG: hypothetical protein AB1792_10900 [Candidatus Zixiibacteriota bacterium]